jgi:hypothetical protein
LEEERCAGLAARESAATVVDEEEDEDEEEEEEEAEAKGRRSARGAIALGLSQIGRSSNWSQMGERGSLSPSAGHSTRRAASERSMARSHAAIWAA